MKRILSIVFFSSCVLPALAQQQPQFSHYGFNGMFLNPAYAGIKGQGDVTLLGRYQYIGYSGTFDEGGSPRTAVLTANLPIAALGGGLGVSLYRDKIAELALTHAELSYSKHIKIGDGLLGVGVQGTFSNVYQGRYRPLDDNDPRVPFEGADNKFDAGAGAWYESSRFYAGLSFNNLLRSTYKFSTEKVNQRTAEFTAENHAYFTAGYNIEASSSVVITPTVLIKTVFPGQLGDDNKFSFKNNSYEAGVRATFDDRFWGGLGYRSGESLTALGGISFAKDDAMRVGLAYDFIAFNQGARATSSLEIMLSYRLPKPGLAIRPAIRTPRYSF
jgi:type IX secretion system PorP/SprF family membrane protein